MRLYKIHTLLILLGTALFWSCSSNNDTLVHHAGEIGLEFKSNQLENDDFTNSNNLLSEIGVFAIKSNTLLAPQNIFGNSDNKRYKQVNGTNQFHSSDSIVLDGITTVDIIAYSPFLSTLDNHVLLVDVSDQSKEGIDLLYSNNIKNITNQSQPELIFKHSLSKLVLEVESDKIIKLERVKGLVTKGCYELADGSWELNADVVTDIRNISASYNNETQKTRFEVYILPNQSLDKIFAEFLVDGKSYHWKNTNTNIIEEGKKYTYNLQIKESGGELIALTPQGTITDWEVGYEQEDPTIILPDDPEEELLFFETYDKSNKVSKDANNNYPLISEFTNYDNKQLKFIDTIGNVDIRSTTSYPNFVWFPSNRDCELQIEGFNLKGYKDVRMEVKVTIDINAKKGNFKLGNLNIFFDNVPLVIPDRIITDKETHNNKFYALEYSDLPGTFDTMKFSIIAANNPGIRLGNIKILGTPIN